MEFNEEIDKRSSGYKRRVEALQSAPDQIPAMIERALIQWNRGFLRVDGHMVYSTTFDSSHRRTRA